MECLQSVCLSLVNSKPSLPVDDHVSFVLSPVAAVCKVSWETGHSFVKPNDTAKQTFNAARKIRSLQTNLASVYP